MSQQLNIIMVPHTHWDREWYQTFQQFRIRLVHTVDKLLDILDRDPHFSHFMLDGQTIILDDYLEVQPEQQGRLKQYIQQGRILIGPWYLQPDEFLVSGEALVRNLQFGLRHAAAFGGAMHVGYLPDCFGHIAQMPQILRGFGIDNAVFWRGVGAEAKQSEFHWLAPDGSEVLAIHLSDPMGYSNARMMPLNPQEFAARVELLSTALLPKATTDTLLFMNGSDHLEPQDGLPAAIEAANTLLHSVSPRHEQLLAQLVMEASHGQLGQQYSSENSKDRHYNSIRVQIGTLPQYIAVVRQQNIQENLQTLQGEMRSSQYAPLLPSVLSSRMWIKQQNTATEHLLERWVEPMTAWATQLGAPYPAGIVRLAWKYLLQNHPHDSICGCSIDQVHAENRVRFAQSQQVGESVLTQALQTIVGATDTRAPFAVTHPSHEPVAIVVFNPAPGPRTALAQAVVQLAGSLHDALLVDEGGASLPYAVINRWSQERGSMELPREAVLVGVAFMSNGEPGSLIALAHSTLNTALGESEDANVITHVRILIDEQKQPGVANIELLIAAKGQAQANEAELQAVESQLLALLNREDIHTLHLSVVDQARETLEFAAHDLPAYGLKTYWLYPRGLEPEQTTSRKGDPLWSPATTNGDPLSSPATTNGDPLSSPANTRRGDPLWSPAQGEEGQGGRPQGIAPTVTSDSIENEWLRVEASTVDGTLTVTDKQTGAVFSGLNRFVDSGDVGDLYTYCPPQNDVVVGAPVEAPLITVVNAGPVRAALRISGRWELPAAADSSRAGRETETVPYAITSEVSLTAGVRRVDIQTSINNTVKDHRLRVLFPVPYSVEHVACEGTFEVRSRPVSVARPADVSAWAETPVSTFPQKRFVDISNGQLGLGVLNRGLPEYEIVPNGPGVPYGGMAVALTLLRSVGWLSRGDLTTRKGHAGPGEPTPDGQCIGDYVFDYALVPHSGDWQADNALVLCEAQAFNTGVRAVTTDLHAGQQPSHSQLVVIEPPELVVSAIKHSNDGQGLVVRLYNPLTQAIAARLQPGTSSASKATQTENDEDSDASKSAGKHANTPLAFTHAFMANLQEEIDSPLPWDNASEAKLLHITIGPREVKTIVFQR